MAIKFYNTLTKKVEDFKPVNEGEVRMYTCGPTVYMYAHIGNFKTFIFEDLLRRYLKYRGYKVVQCMNITDVGHLTQDDIDAGEDKMAVAARREGKSIKDIAEYYTKAFFEDWDALGLERAEYHPKATDYVPRMIEWIEGLEKEGYAYQAGDSVYFDVRKFADYGKLSGNRLEDLEAGARIEVREEKRHPADFLLWKADSSHLMKWESPWGEGYPGWHIECTVMGVDNLGAPFDIHTGGVDNIFPHHEAEIAQGEALLKKPVANYWLHSEHFLVGGKKMSKSEGNFYTVRDIIEKGYDPRALRYVLMSSHYKAQFNFTLESLDAAKTGIDRFGELIKAMRAVKAEGGALVEEIKKAGDEADAKFTEALDNDLNIAPALAAVFDYVRTVNSLRTKEGFGQAEAEAVLSRLERFDSVLGVMDFSEGEELAPEYAALITERERARENKDFARADAIRDELKAAGILIEDTPDGTIWKKA